MGPHYEPKYEKYRNSTLFYKVDFKWFFYNGLYGKIWDFGDLFDYVPTKIGRLEFDHGTSLYRLKFWPNMADGSSLKFPLEVVEVLEFFRDKCIETDSNRWEIMRNAYKINFNSVSIPGDA